MLVSLYSQSSATLDLPAEVQWSTSNGQQFGSAKLTIPRTSRAWSADIVTERGGFLVRIHTPVGDWIGLADTPSYTPVGMTLDVLHLNTWASIRHVAPYRRFCGVSGGIVAKRAVEDALLGLGSIPVTIGPILVAPPIVNFEFKRQTLLSVLTDLSKLTGQQWTIGNDLQFRWVSQIGKYREFVWIDDGKYLPRLQRTPLADQHREHIEVDPAGRTFTAHDRTTPALWPSQQIVRI